MMPDKSTEQEIETAFQNTLNGFRSELEEDAKKEFYRVYRAHVDNETAKSPQTFREPQWIPCGEGVEVLREEGQVILIQVPFSKSVSNGKLDRKLAQIATIIRGVISIDTRIDFFVEEDAGHFLASGVVRQ